MKNGVKNVGKFIMVNISEEDKMNKYTVFFDERIRTNFQVLAKNIYDAELKAIKLYNENIPIPYPDTKEGWISENDGEDK